MPYEKLAQRLLQDHGSDGSFEVTFFEKKELEAVAEHLEKLGCTVVKDPMSQCLTVTPPTPVANGHH